MFSLFKEIRILRQEGKIHKKLLIRIRIMFLISIILGSISVYNFLFREASIWISIFLVGIGFVLGLRFFSRMNVMSWNEEVSVVQAEKMDKIGFFVLVIYIIFEIGIRNLFKSYIPHFATVFIMDIIFGTILGRVIGMMADIHRVFLSSRGWRRSPGVFDIW